MWNKKEAHRLHVGYNIWPWPLTSLMTLTLDVSRSNFEIALSQEWGAWLTWNEKDESHPFKTMILTSVTMVGWADVPDSDRGDFRRRRAIDISSYMNGSYMCLIYICMYIAMYMACGYMHTFKKLGFNRQSLNSNNKFKVNLIMRIITTWTPDHRFA